MPRLRDTVRDQHDEQRARKQPQTLREGPTWADRTHQLAIHCSPPTRARQGRPFRPANTQATSRAPARRSTRTPCKGQLTRRESTQLLRALSGRAFAPAVPSDDARRSPATKVRLVHLDGRERKSARSWCCARSIRMRRPARKHGALGERASRCNGGARARRALQQAGARAQGAACLVAPATTTAAKGRRELKRSSSGYCRWTRFGLDIGPYPRTPPDPPRGSGTVPDPPKLGDFRILSESSAPI